MSGTVLLVALVVGAAVVSAALTRAGRGAGGGAIYLLLGLLMGPRLLGLVEEDTVAALRPALHVACGWVGLVVGMRQRRRHLQRLGAAGLLGLAIEWGVTALVLASILRPALGQVLRPDEEGALPVLAIAAAVVCAASGPGLFGWARRTLRAQGPVVDRLSALAHNDMLLTLLSLVALTALSPPTGAPAPPGRALFVLLVGLGLGPLLGGAYTLLAGRRPERDTAWVLLIGVLLLGAGVATRLGLPAMTVCYLLGVTIAVGSADHPLLDEVAGQTRAPVEVLVLILCGLGLTVRPALLPVCGLALLGRVLGKILGGGAAGVRPAGGGPSSLGWTAGAGLLGFGAVPLAAALQVDLLYAGQARGAVSEIVLGLAAAQLIAGDLLGPVGLRALLGRAGELPPREAP